MPQGILKEMLNEFQVTDSSNVIDILDHNNKIASYIYCNVHMCVVIKSAENIIKETLANNLKPRKILSYY